MTFLVDEAYLPAILTVGPMTDEAFAQRCAEHPNLNLEMSAHGELIIMPLAFTWKGARNNEIYPTARAGRPMPLGSLNSGSRILTQPPSAAIGPYVPTSS